MKHFQNSSFTIDEVEKFLGYSLKKVGVGHSTGGYAPTVMKRGAIHMKII